MLIKVVIISLTTKIGPGINNNNPGSPQKTATLHESSRIDRRELN